MKTAVKQTSKTVSGSMPWLMEHINLGSIVPHAEVAVIGPELATFLLSRNPDNRRILSGRVKAYAARMSEGAWLLNGETIIVSKDGYLNDGQNRLTAIIESGVSIQSFIVFGIERESRKTVDVGAVKSAAGFLGMDGLSHPDMRAAIARLLLAYEASEGRNISTKNSYDAIDCYNRACDDVGIGLAADFVTAHYKAIRAFISPATIGLCHYLLTNTGHDGAITYLTQVAYGEDISRGDPAYAVRERLLALGKVRPAEKLEIVLRGWLAFRKGEQRMKLMLLGGDLPALA